MLHARPIRGRFCVPGGGFASAGLALGLLVMVLNGCAAPAPPPTLVDPEEAAFLNLTPVWATDLSLPKDQHVNHARILGDLLLVAEAPEPLLTAVEIQTGEVRWRRRLGEGVFPLSRPMRREDEVVIVVDATQVAVVDADNASLRSYQELENTASSQPELDADVVVYGGLNGVGTTHNLDLGFANWRYALPYRIVARPAIDGGQVFLCDSGGTYAMLEAANGELLWRGRTFEGITADPAFADSGVLVPSEDGTLYVLDPRTGVDLWVHHTTARLNRSATQFGQNIYLPVPGQALRALDAFTGEVVWEAPADTRPVRLRNGELLVYDGDALRVLDPGDGREIRAADVLLDHVEVLDGPGSSLTLVGRRGRILRLDNLE